MRKVQHSIVFALLTLFVAGCGNDVDKGKLKGDWLGRSDEGTLVLRVTDDKMTLVVVRPGRVSKQSFNYTLDGDKIKHDIEGAGEFKVAELSDTKLVIEEKGERETVKTEFKRLSEQESSELQRNFGFTLEEAPAEAPAAEGEPEGLPEGELPGGPAPEFDPAVIEDLLRGFGLQPRQ